MRRNRSDSIAEQQKIITASDVKPPEHMLLREQDKPFWDAIISARAKTTWIDADLIHACNLSRCLADIETLSVQVCNESDTIKTPSGLVRVNPKHTLLETLTRRSVALSRLLCVHTVATQGRSRDVGERTRRERELLDSQPDGDNLLAKPLVQ